MPEYHVFVRRGDARAEVDGVLRELELTPEQGGLHKYLFVTKADQTVVMLASPQAPLAGALRGRRGWAEPAAGSGH
jgi:hypothetical protein